MTLFEEKPLLSNDSNAGSVSLLPSFSVRIHIKHLFGNGLLKLYLFFPVFDVKALTLIISPPKFASKL